MSFLWKTLFFLPPFISCLCCFLLIFDTVSSLQGFSQAEKNGFSSPGVRWLSSCRASLWAGRDKSPRESPSWRLFTAGSEGRRLDRHRQSGGGESRPPLIFQSVSEWLTLAIRRGCWSHRQHLPNRTVSGAITSPWPFVMREAWRELASLSLPGQQALPMLSSRSPFLCNFHIPLSGWGPYDGEQCQ